MFDTDKRLGCNICNYTCWDLRDFHKTNVPKRCDCCGGPHKLYELLKNTKGITSEQVENFAKYWRLN